jgi:hypothetical protein
LILLLIFYSDPSAPPQKQTEQILAIYPILPGQPKTRRPSIPAQASSPKSVKKSTKQVAEKEEDSLIDFGNDEASAPTPAAKKPGEIETLLAATGKPADGPLIDFAQDLKKDLPADGDLL